jgi:hypothetical protein
MVATKGDEGNKGSSVGCERGSRTVLGGLKVPVPCGQPSVRVNEVPVTEVRGDRDTIAVPDPAQGEQVEGDRGDIVCISSLAGAEAEIEEGTERVGRYVSSCPPSLALT